MSHRLLDPKYLVSRWMLQGNALDGMKRYPGTLVNSPTWSTFFKNDRQCIELNGDNQYVNVGDVAELNVVSQFSMSYWVYQDIVPVTDYIFEKSGGVRTMFYVNGHLYVVIDETDNAYGRMDGYANIIPVKTWSHCVQVFDGTKTGDDQRLVFYVNGERQVLLFLGNPIPATTRDSVGVDLTIGRSVESLNGRIFDFRLYSCALTQDEILSLFHAPVPMY